MSEVELAAKKFELLAAGAPLSNVLYGYPSQKRLWGLAASALREQAERGKGCGFCMTGEGRPAKMTMYSASHEYAPGFCPECGRCLEEKRDE